MLVHRDVRRRGLGQAVTSAAVAWAVERGWTVEWSTWLGNPASMALAEGLGFARYATEQEFTLREEQPL